MTKRLRCADVTGECDAVVTGDTDQEILDQDVPHAKEAHDLEDSEELRVQLTAAIQDA